MYCNLIHKILKLKTLNNVIVNGPIIFDCRYPRPGNTVKCHTVRDSVPASRFSSRFSSSFNKLGNSCIIYFHGTKKHTMLFDISATTCNLFIIKSVVNNNMKF